LVVLNYNEASGTGFVTLYRAGITKVRPRRELQSVFVFVFFSLATPKHLNEPAAMARKRLLQASRELRAMLNIGPPGRESDVTRLSDAELIQQLSDQAKELGIGIDLNYRFAEPPKPEE
jgi:hypothetical protein